MFPTINGNALRERWGAAPVFELARIIRAGELVPIYEMAGGRRTAEADPCLVCSACEVPNPEGHHGREIECEHSRNGHGEQIPCRGRWEVYARALRINEAIFYLREVEAYERAHGWHVDQPEPAEEVGLEEESPTRCPDLTTRERQTHQVIIAALCKKIGIDWEAEGAAGKISRAIDNIGGSASLNTIRKILKELPESIESRKK